MSNEHAAKLRHDAKDWRGGEWEDGLATAIIEEQAADEIDRLVLRLDDAVKMRELAEKAMYAVQRALNEEQNQLRIQAVEYRELSSRLDSAVDALTSCHQAVPGSWLDEMLSGPKAVKVNNEGNGVEKLLDRIRERIREIIDPFLREREERGRVVERGAIIGVDMASGTDRHVETHQPNCECNDCYARKRLSE